MQRRSWIVTMLALVTLGVLVGCAGSGNQLLAIAAKPTAPAAQVAPATLAGEATLPGVRAARTSTGQVITPKGSFTPIAFDSTRWDNGGWFSEAAGGTRFVCPEGADGTYEAIGMVQFSGPSPAVGDRVLAIVKNGMPARGPLPAYLVAEVSAKGSAAEPTLPGSGGNALNVSGHVQLHAGDYIELWVWHNATTNLSILSGDGLHEPFLSLQFVSPL